MVLKMSMFWKIEKREVDFVGEKACKLGAGLREPSQLASCPMELDRN